LKLIQHTAEQKGFEK